MIWAFLAGVCIVILAEILVLVFIFYGATNQSYNLPSIDEYDSLENNNDGK